MCVCCSYSLECVLLVLLFVFFFFFGVCVSNSTPHVGKTMGFQEHFTKIVERPIVFQLKVTAAGGEAHK